MSLASNSYIPDDETQKTTQVSVLSLAFDKEEAGTAYAPD